MRTAGLAAASLLVVATPARADEKLPTIDTVFPPAVRVEVDAACRMTVQRIALEVRPEVSWITLEVATRYRFCDRGEMLLDLPAGTRVVGMSVATRGERSWSAARPRLVALDALRDEADASALAWTGTSAGQDHVRIVARPNARIEIAVELPPLAVLRIDPEGREVPRVEARVADGEAHEWRNQRAPIDLDVREVSARVDRDAYPHATADTWLVAGAPDRHEPRIEHRFPASPSRATDGAIVRSAMRANLPRFTHCYERIEQWGFGVDGQVSVKFFIATDGKVTRADVDGTLPRPVTDCIAEVVKAWPFPPMEMPLQVTYPLTFRLYP